MKGTEPMSRGELWAGQLDGKSRAWWRDGSEAVNGVRNSAECWAEEGGTSLGGGAWGGAVSRKEPVPKTSCKTR